MWIVRLALRRACRLVVLALPEMGMPLLDP